MMKFSGSFGRSDGSLSSTSAVVLLSLVVAPYAPIALAQSGFEFTGENCIEAFDLGEFQAATISMWVKLGEPPEQELSLLSTHGWDESALHLLLTDERRVLLTVNGNEPGEVVSRGALGERNGGWAHLTVVLDHKNRRWKIYLDGQLDRVIRLEHVVPVNLNDFRIGAWNVEPRAFVGWMDDIRIYDRALAADEITALANHDGPKRDLLAWWPLDRADGDHVGDASGHEHHGAICHAGDLDVEDEDEWAGEDGSEPVPPDPPPIKPSDPVRSLRQAIDAIAEQFPGYEIKARQLSARVDGLGPQEPEGKQLDLVRYDALVRKNPLMDFDKLLFIKRYTYQSSHFYTDFIDGCVRFGGNLCILDLETGEATDLVPEMSDGIFGRFDLHFSATKIVFDWKPSPREGFRIYEVNIDPETGRRTGGPRQLTYPPDDEAARIAKYAHPRQTPGPGAYYHQTDDMHPCYLPDGGIIFTSTRCEYGTLCDPPDILATTVLHRMDGDGSHLEKLTNSAVSEFCPTVMADGRVLYTRWEYVDKGQLGVKCLWAMRPDGTGSEEIYGNDIPFPPTFMHGRQIPDSNRDFVFVGAPHFPQGGSFGTLIRVDAQQDIRTRQPMTYLTPNVDVRQEAGWNQWRAGGWRQDERGPLYTDPYPLSSDFFLVSHNPDRPWNDESAYGLYLLDSFGNHQLLYRDEQFTCRQPYPLRPRTTPPVLRTDPDTDLARRNLALCSVANVHYGMEGIEPGAVKYLRVMEQIPRPWDARRFWDPACDFDNHTHLVSQGIALGAKVMWGVVPVEDDGSACFYVPADRNIYLQALDEDFMELQRERTYVNYRPGEMRGCVGCHERPNEVPKTTHETLLAMHRPPRMPRAQPGDDRPEQVIHYPTYVQPVLNRFCVQCHDSVEPPADLDLTGALTTHFSRSYEHILDRGLIKTYRENSDFGGTHYVPPKTIGSHASRLMAQVRTGCPGMKPLPRWAFVRLATWVDAAAVYYGSYWGRRHIEFKDHPFFRPVPTFEEAISTVCPVPLGQR